MGSGRQTAADDNGLNTHTLCNLRNGMSCCVAELQKKGDRRMGLGQGAPLC